MSTMSTVTSWSGGKDSAYAYGETDLDVRELLVTYSMEDLRTGMHGLRVDAVEAQAEAMGLQLNAVATPSDDEGYADVMEAVMEEYVSRGFSRVLYGDINLEDVRGYREANLAEVEGLEGVWPIWGRDTREVALAVAEGYDVRVVSAHDDLEWMVGRRYTRGLLDELPEDVDPCGENGEFHTYVYDAPYFDEAVSHGVGKTVERELSNGDTYHYVDIEV